MVVLLVLSMPQSLALVPCFLSFFGVFMQVDLLIKVDEFTYSLWLHLRVEGHALVERNPVFLG